MSGVVRKTSEIATGYALAMGESHKGFGWRQGWTMAGGGHNQGLLQRGGEGFATTVGKDASSAGGGLSMTRFESFFAGSKD